MCAGYRQSRRPHRAHRTGRQARVRGVRDHRSQGRRGDVGRRRGDDRDGHGLSGGAQDRLAGDPAQDRGGRRAGRREERRGSPEGLRHHHRQREEVQREGEHSRRPGAADARRRPGSDHRRGHRSRVRQAGRLRSGRRPGRSAQGHHVPSRARDRGRRVVDARRHRGGADPQGRPRCGSGQSRRAREDDPERVAAHRRLSGNRGDGPEPGLRHQGRGDRGRRPDRRQFLAGAGAVPPEARRHRARHEPHHEAEGGRRHRRLVGGRQDRQLGDEEPDQRRLQGADLPDQPVRRRDHGAEGVQERQGRSRRHRRRGVRDSGQVRGGGGGRVRREEDSGRRPHSVRVCRDRQRRGTAGDRRGRPQVRRPPDGPEHLRFLLHVEQPLRDVLHGVRRQGQRGAVVAVGRHRDGDHRLLPLGEDGRLGHRRSGQQGGYRRGRSADVLRAGRQHARSSCSTART